jgi:hypothetical protein
MFTAGAFGALPNCVSAGESIEIVVSLSAVLLLPEQDASKAIETSK